MKKFLENFIFSSRWLLYPINVALIVSLVFFIYLFLKDGTQALINGGLNLETMTIFMLSLVDSAMVSNLIILVAQGSHQIFIKKFKQEEVPQFLDHIDTGILKIKVALSICGISLIQVLKDFMNIEHIEWNFILHRLIIHSIMLLSALIISIIWRITHPTETHSEKSHV